MVKVLNLRLRNNHADVEIDACPDGKLRRPVRISDVSVLLHPGFAPGQWTLILGSISSVSSPLRSKHLSHGSKLKLWLFLRFLPGEIVRTETANGILDNVS